MCTLSRTYAFVHEPPSLSRPKQRSETPRGANFIKTLICLDLVSFNFPHQRPVATFEGSEPTVSMSALEGKADIWNPTCNVRR
jgi:hypothetical protein